MTFWENRPVFITGATGLVGSWLTTKLYQEQADIVILMRDWNPHSLLVRNGVYDKVRHVHGDIENSELMDRTISDYEIDTVFHLAAQAIVPIANRHPKNTIISNVVGVVNVLEAVKKSKLVKSIVVSSSDKAYGENVILPYTESTPLNGLDPYACSKSSEDLISQTYNKSYDLPVAIARCGNIFGGGDFNWNRLVPGTIRSVLLGKNPVIRSNGLMVRDYFYVEDAVNAYICLAESRVTGAYNFGNEEPRTVIGMTNEILRLMESKLEPAIMNLANNEIAEQSLCTKKAREELNWNPAFTLEEGLKKTIAWYKDYFDE
jgi:CDP-glucose 4,6-dehydratase